MKRGSAFPFLTVLGFGVVLAFALPGRAAEDPPAPGTLITVAGIGKPGFSGDGGPAVQAQLSIPRGIAFDAAGDLFITEFGNSRVRKVTGAGMITTVAGVGREGFSGDNGPAIQAEINSPRGITVDGTGRFFFGDLGNQRVRQVSPDGLITTVAGNGKEGFSGDGGPAAEARLTGPHDVAVDAAGNLFIAEEENHRVRRVSPEGIITTVAGTGTPDFSGEGGPAVEAALDTPRGLAVDADGNLFIADTENHRIRKVNPNGIITTIAGTGEDGFSGDGGRATAAQLSSPYGIAVDMAGNLFIADLFNHRVRKVSPEGIITTVAGDGREEFAGEGGPATAAGLRGPLGVAVDAAGNLFVADSGFVTGRQDGRELNERVVKMVGVAAPGLIAGRPFPE